MQPPKILTALLRHCCCRYPTNSCSKASVAQASFLGLTHHYAASRQGLLLQMQKSMFAFLYLGREQVSWSKTFCFTVVVPHHLSQIRG